MNSYKTLCTEYYDIDKPDAPEEALNFYLHYAEKADGPIIELMSGSGRFLIPLLERQYDIDGLDASLLEIEQLISKPTDVGLWRGRWVERSDGAKILINWLSYYNDARRISHSIHRYELIKDGQLLKTEYEDFDLRLYDPEEFRTLLEAAGFKEIRTFKAHQFRAPDETDKSIIFECSK